MTAITFMEHLYCLAMRQRCASDYAWLGVVELNTSRFHGSYRCIIAVSWTTGRGSDHCGVLVHSPTSVA